MKFNERQIMEGRMTRREVTKENRKIQKEKERLFKDFNITVLKAKKYLKDIFSENKSFEWVS
jgi:hypothetical protein